MIKKDNRPGRSDRGDVDDLSRVGTDRTGTTSLSAVTAPEPYPAAVAAARERRARMSWGERHRRRVDRIDGGCDPWTGDHHRDWTDAELRAWGCAASHLRVYGLYGAWQFPEAARQAWRCQRCPCQRVAS